MMTEQEQMDRYNDAVTELYSLQRKQMRKLTESSWGTQNDPIAALYDCVGTLLFWDPRAPDVEAKGKVIASAANYLVMAFDRIREEGGA